MTWTSCVTINAIASVNVARTIVIKTDCFAVEEKTEPSQYAKDVSMTWNKE
jgi:hypothetical protein